MKKRIFSLLLAFVMLVGQLPLPAQAAVNPETNLCEHHTEHDVEFCGEPCRYTCPECAQAQEEPDPAALVQALIDDLPDSGDITADNAESVGAQLTAIDEAMAEYGFGDAEKAQLDASRYLDAVAALEILAGQEGAGTPVPAQVSSWVDTSLNMQFNILSGQKVSVINKDKERTSGDIPATVTYEGVTYTVTEIDDFSMCLEMETVTIPDTVTSIKKGAFSNCKALTSVTIPESVTSIGTQAFYSCDALTSVQIQGKLTALPEQLFYKCTSLETVNIPEGVTSIGEGAFYWCNMTSLNIPDSVTSFGAEAFAQCPKLESVNIPSGVTVLPRALFYECKALKSVSIPSSVTAIEKQAFYWCETLTEIEIPNSVETIGEQAFDYCKGLTSVKIPGTVKSISNGVFGHCEALKSITIPGTVESIGNRAFIACAALESVTIEEGIKTIGEEAFAHCTGLESITIPNGVTSLGESAFRSCSKLQSVVLPATLNAIESLTFNWCEALTSITIPESVTSIGESAFSRCTALKSITIPKDVNSVAGKAFQVCSALETVIFTNPTPPATKGSGAFYNCNNLTIYVPAGSVEAYKSGTWADYNIVALSDTPAHTHSWSTEWSKNETSHWKACTAEGCDITDYSVVAESGYAAHVYDKDNQCECGAIRIEKIIVTGGGQKEGNDWPNGDPWNNMQEANRMTEISKGVYQIQYTGVAADQYQFKFVSNGSWDAPQWGREDSTPVESGTSYDAIYYAQNIYFNVTADNSTVTLTLNLSDPNAPKFTVQVVGGEAPAGHTHCVCGKHGCTDSSHGGEITYLPWSEVMADAETVSQGNYGSSLFFNKDANVYLDTEVTLAQNISCRDTTLNLCLNGNILNTADKQLTSEESMTGTFHLSDCGGTGKITGGVTKAPIRVANGTFTMYSGTISGNTARAIHIERYGSNYSAEAHILGGALSNNSTTTSPGGGAIYMKNGDLVIGGSAVISGNEAKSGTSGGAIAVESGSSAATLAIGGNAQITGNTAANEGGAIYAYSKTTYPITSFTISGNTLISGNTATYAGAVSVYAAGVTISDDVKITGNTTTNGLMWGDTHFPAVSFSVSTSEGTVKIADNVQIYDNKQGASGEQYNVTVRFQNLLDLTQLGSNANISINRMSNIAPAEGTDVQISTANAAIGAENQVHSDDPQYYIARKDGVIYMTATKPHEHAYSETWTSDETHHWKTCSGCAEKDSYAEHVYTDGKCTCGKDEPAGHTHDEITFAEWTADGLPMESGSYCLTKDVTLTEAWGPVKDQTVNLCLHGHSITQSTSGKYCISLPNNSVLNLYDCAEVPGKITHAPGATGSAVYIKVAEFNLHGGNITGNTAEYGAGVYLYYGAFNMKGGSISGNTASDSGGGVYLSDGTFTMSGGSITGNTVTKSSGTGGGVRNSNNNCTTILEGGVISGNKCGSDGGGVYNSGNLTIRGTVFIEKNEAVNGGGVYTSRNVTIQGGTIRENKAEGMGGAIYTSSSTAYLKMEGGSILNNTAGNWGGGVNHSNGKFELFGGTITGNRAPNWAGIHQKATLKLSGNVVVKDNKTTDNAASNLVIREGGTIEVNPMGENASVGVTISNGNFESLTGVVSSNAASAYKRAFSADDSRYYLEANTDGKLILTDTPHIHDWSTTWTSDAGGHWYGCSGCDEKQEYATHTAPDDDGDCTTAVTCKTCGYIFTAAKDHSFTDGWDLDCNNDGCNYTRQAHKHDDIHYAAWSDGSSLPSQGGNYYLTGDVTITGAWLPNGTVNLCLNGHSITKAGQQDETIRVFDGDILSIYDCQGTGKITHAEGVKGSGLYIGGGSATLLGGSITGNSFTYGGVQVLSGGSFTMSGGSIHGNTATSVGGGVYVAQGGRVTMTGGEIRNNTSNQGGGVYNAGSFTMSGGSITGNAAPPACGGVYNTGDFTLDGGAISGNTAEQSGGVGNYGKFLMTGGEITGNTAQDETGGGVENYKTFIMEGGTISGNTAKTDGGGVYNRQGAFTMEGGKITGNTAQASGGGVYNLSTFTLSGGAVSGNTAAKYGGGVYNASSFTMTSGEIKNNKAAELGGGVYNSNGTFAMEGGSITGNTAETANGGGVYNVDAFTLSGGEITGNTAAQHGGGVYNIGSMTVSGSVQIQNNTATKLSSDLALHDTKTVTVEALTEGASLGVARLKLDLENGSMISAGGVFTANAASQYQKYFFPTDDKYTIRTDSDNKLILVDRSAHYHDGVTYDTPWSGEIGGTTLSESANIVLTGDVTFSDRLTIGQSATVNLCLNGKTLNLGSNYIDNSGTLNICDCETGGQICSTVNGSVISNHGTMTVTSGTINGAGTGTQGIHVSGGTVTVKGGAINGDTYGMLNSGGTVEVQAGAIKGKTGIYQRAAGTLAVSGGTITGTVYYGIGNEGTVTVTAGSISGGNGIKNESGSLYLSGTPTIAGEYGPIYAVGGSIYATETAAAASPKYTGDPLAVSLLLTKHQAGDILIHNATLTEGKFTLTDTDFVLKQGTEANANHLVLGLPSYAVTFDMNGQEGTAPASQSVEKGSTVTQPDDPMADGFLFGGWYKEETCTTPWDFDADTVAGATTLYAKWTAAHYHETENITFRTVWDSNMAATTLSADANIVLDGNITFSGDLTIGQGATVNLCLNGKQLNMGSHYIQNNGTLNICDCQTTPGTINGTGGYSIYNNGLYNGGMLTISSVTITATGNTGLGINNYCGTVTVNSGTIIGANTGIQSPQGGKVTVNDGTITGGSYGIFNQFGTVTIYKGTITGTGKNSYGIFSNSGTLTVEGGTIKTTGDRGTGIYNYNSTLTVTGGTITATGTDSEGIYNSKGTAEISGGKISGTRQGIFNSATLTLKGGTITGGEYGISNEENLYLSGSPAIEGEIAAVYAGSGSIYATDAAGAAYTGAALTVCVQLPENKLGNVIVCNAKEADKKFSLINEGYFLEQGTAENANHLVLGQNTYTVTFDPNGGTGEAFTRGTSGQGFQVSLPNEVSFTKTGYTFAGWSNKADFEDTTNQWQDYTGGDGTSFWRMTDSERQITFMADTTLYAVWVKDTIQSISVTTQPTKTSYVYGESFDKTGMVVTARYLLGSEKDVTDAVAVSPAAMTVGQISVTLSYSEDGKTVTCDVTGLTVSKKQLDVSGLSWNAETFTYDGTEKTIKLTGTLPEGVAVQMTGNAGTDAGGYTASAAFTLAEGYSADNYEIVGTTPLEADWNIAKATPVSGDFTFTQPENLVYDGSSKTAGVKTGAKGMGEIRVKYYQNNAELSGAPAAVGTYTVKIDVAEGSNYLAATNLTGETWTFTIAQAALKDVSVVQAGTLTYNGAAQTADVEAKATTANGETVTFTYSTAENGPYSPAVPVFTEGGSHTVWFKAKAENHAEFTDFFTIVIGKASTTASLYTFTAPENLTYDGQPKEAIVIPVSGIEGTGSITAVTYYKDGTKLTGAPTDVGAYTVAIDVAEGQNYGAASGITADSWTFTIAKAVVTEPSIDSKPYNGANQTADVEPSDLYTVLENKGGTDKGSYNVVLELTDSANYKWSSVETPEVTLTFAVTKVQNSWTEKPAIESWTYGDPKEPVGRAEFGSVVFSWYDVSKNLLSAKPVDAGNYYMMAFVPADGENYDAIQTGYLPFSIAKAAVTEPAIDGKVYNGQNQTADIADTDLYIVATNNGGTASGSYPVVLKLTDSANYRWATTAADTVTLTFTIRAGENQWTEEPAISGWTYGEPKEPVGEAKFGEVVFTWYDSNKAPLAAKPVNAGDYYMKASVPADGNNYAAITKDFLAFTIAKAKLTPAIHLTENSKVYDGSTAVTGASIVLTGAVSGEQPAATAASYAYNSANVAQAEKITATGIALTGTWGNNYELTDTTAEIPATITKADQQAPSDGEGYTIDYAAETITVTENYEVRTARTEGEAVPSGSITGHLGEAAKTLYIRKAELDNYHASEWTPVILAARPGVPPLSVSNETIKGRQDGQITGLDATMEISINGAAWTAAAGDLTGLAGGTQIKVRVAATETAPHGVEATCTIAEGRALTVTFDSRGGSTVAAITGLSYNAVVAAPAAPAKSGYTFAGWYTDAACTTAYDFAAKVTEDIALFAKWEVVTYTITYELNGGTNAASNPGSYTVESDTITLADPTRRAYAFEGWYSDSGFTTRVQTIPAGTTGSITLHAKWEKVIFTITFDPNGGKVHPRSAETGLDGTLRRLPTPEREDYVFEGWYTGKHWGRKVTLRTVFDEDTTVYARWSYRPADSDSPKTGDITHSGLWLTLAAVGLLGLTASIAARKRYRKR